MPYHEQATMAFLPHPFSALPLRRCCQSTNTLCPARPLQNLLAPMPSHRRRTHVTPYAATGGAVLSVNHLRLQAGTRDLMYIPRWSITPGTTVGIVGANGCGKSTLLRAFADPEFRSAIQVGPGSSLGYLPQQAVSGSEKTVWDEAGSEMVELRKAEADLRLAEATADEEGGAKRLEKAMSDFEREGGYEQDEKIARVLGGLGFAKDDWDRKCMELSGGWQMRVALARLLLREPTVMLLDEPTNHLDAAAKAYLTRYLREYRHSVVLVSHDVPLLDGCCSRIVEIEQGRFEDYPGCNYTKFLEEKQARALSAMRAAAKTEAEAEKLENFITRFGAKATKAKSAQSKQKALDKLLAENPADAKLGAEDRHQSTMRITLPPAPPCAREAIVLENADVGYDPGEPLIRNVSLVLERGNRYGICGLNGVGKSTLLATLAGNLPALNDDAVRRVGDDRVSCGVFTQDLAADLPIEKSGLEHLEAVAPDLTRERLRGTLGAMGIRGPAALRQMKFLSGGEQARVALASFVVQSHNVLFCDEISNHLDVESVDTICEALVSFDGIVVVVSHDKRLIERVATHCIVVDNQAAKIHVGVPESALEMVTVSGESGGGAAAGPDLAGGRIRVAEEVVDDDKEARAVAFQSRKEAQRRLSRAQKRLPSLEREIIELEEKLEVFQEEMAIAGSNAEKAMEAHSRVQSCEAAIEKLYEEMQDVEEILLEQ